MSRIQLALNVPDIDEAVEFYTTFFGTEPHKRRPGYANFAILDPPLKLVLFEHEDGEQLNHLGVEVDDTDEVGEAVRRLRGAGMELEVREQELCCHAVQDKLWASGAGTRWEVYAITDDLLDAAPVAPVAEVCCSSTDTTAAACC